MNDIKGLRLKMIQEEEQAKFRKLTIISPARVECRSAARYICIQWRPRIALLLVLWLGAGDEPESFWDDFIHHPVLLTSKE